MNTVASGTRRAPDRPEWQRRVVLSRPTMFPAAAFLAAYLFSLVAANVASVHWPPMLIGGVLVPAGTVFAGAALTARDLVQDTTGVRGVAAGIVAGAGLSLVFASPQIAVAGLVAFSASEIVDALVYTRLRRCGRLRAVAVSNAVGVVIDSVVFVPLAFGGLAAVPGQILGKTLATLVTLAVLGLASRCARPVPRAPDPVSEFADAATPPGPRSHQVAGGMTASGDRPDRRRHGRMGRRRVALWCRARARSCRAAGAGS